MSSDDRVQPKKHCSDIGDDNRSKWRHDRRGHRDCSSGLDRNDGKDESNESGFYQLANLPPGAYSLRVESPGFEGYVQNGIVLQVDQSATVNVALKIGSQAESVTVTGEPPLVDTRSQTISTVITSELARELPLNGRNVLQLMSLGPM